MTHLFITPASDSLAVGTNVWLELPGFRHNKVCRPSTHTHPRSVTPQVRSTDGHHQTRPQPHLVQGYQPALSHGGNRLCPWTYSLTRRLWDLFQTSVLRPVFTDHQTAGIFSHTPCTFHLRHHGKDTDHVKHRKNLDVIWSNLCDPLIFIPLAENRSDGQSAH